METFSKVVYIIRESNGKYLLFHEGGTYETDDIFKATFFYNIEFANSYVKHTDRAIVEFSLTGIAKG